MDTDRKAAARRINKLRAEIAHHRYVYHVLDRQEISDAALDSLKHELKELENAYPSLVTEQSPTQRVSGAVKSGFKKVKHDVRMLSIEDAFSRADVEAWLSRLQNRFGVESPELFCEVKMDGLAMALRYENGELHRAVTRGTGEVGEDVTHNARAIVAIPLALRQPTADDLLTLKGAGASDDTLERLGDVTKLSLEVRGEVYMPKDVFEAMNKREKKQGREGFANPRNVAAGTIRQLDPQVTADRDLRYFGYALLTDMGLATHALQHVVLQTLGIPVNPLAKRAMSLDVVEAFYRMLQKKRDRLNYWTDGMVININDTRSFDALGVAGKAPRGALAWKFPAQEATTILRDVSWSVGRTGVVTPVAELEPITVGGTVVRHASLHNMDEIKRLEVRVGDTVIVHKAGDIIPKVVRALPELRTGAEKKIRPPETCPACGTKLEQHPDEVALVCDGRDCFARLRQRIIYAVSKQGFDIEGLGEKTVEQLLDKGLIHNISSIFLLTKDELRTLDGFGDVSADKLFKEIQAHKRISLPRFLTAVGIPHVGSETALRIAEHFGSLDALMRAKRDDLLEVDDVGDVVAQAIEEFFERRHVRENIAEFRKQGGEILSHKRRGGRLRGKVFVLTGTLKHMTRAEAKAAIEALGGKVSSAVGRQTDYVVVGADPGSKAKVAERLGVSLLNEREFFTIIGAELS